MSEELNLSEAQVAIAREKFSTYDVDNSGAIDKQELEKLVLDLEPKMPGVIRKRMVTIHMTSSDKNDDGVIDFDEFLVLFKKTMVEAKLPISFGPRC